MRECTFFRHFSQCELYRLLIFVRSCLCASPPPPSVMAQPPRHVLWALVLRKTSIHNLIRRSVLAKGWLGVPVVGQVWRACRSYSWWPIQFRLCQPSLPIEICNTHGQATPKFSQPALQPTITTQFFLTLLVNLEDMQSECTSISGRSWKISPSRLFLYTFSFFAAERASLCGQTPELYPPIEPVFQRTSTSLLGSSDEDRNSVASSYSGVAIQHFSSAHLLFRHVG